MHILCFNNHYFGMHLCFLDDSRISGLFSYRVDAEEKKQLGFKAVFFILNNRFTMTLVFIELQRGSLESSLESKE